MEQITNKPELPAKKYADIINEAKLKGQKLESRFSVRINQARDRCFDYMKVSSPDELFEELGKKVKEMDKYPFGFFSHIGLDQYSGEIKAFNRGEERCVFITEDKNDEQELNHELDSEEQKVLNSLEGSLMPHGKIAGIVWKSKGFESGDKFFEYSHNGVVLNRETRGHGYGYALYRIYEEVFGKMKEEITAKLSLLKLYLQLGFEPKKIISPLDGKEMKLDPKDTVERYFQENKEDLPFCVYLERNSENKENQSVRG